MTNAEKYYNISLSHNMSVSWPLCKVSHLSISFISWRSGKAVDDQKQVSTAPICKRSKVWSLKLQTNQSYFNPLKRHSWNILMEAVSSHQKVTGKSQHEFTKDKSCLISLMAFYIEVSCLVGEGRAMASLTLTLTKFLIQHPRTSLLTSW